MDVNGTRGRAQKYMKITLVITILLIRSTSAQKTLSLPHSGGLELSANQTKALEVELEIQIGYQLKLCAKTSYQDC